MAITCSVCKKADTVSVFYHKCNDRNWFAVASVDPLATKDRKHPKKPKPGVVSCPDGLIGLTNRSTITFRDADPRSCDNPDGNLVKASALYCYNCHKVTEVYTTTPARRPVKRLRARKQTTKPGAEMNPESVRSAKAKR